MAKLVWHPTIHVVAASALNELSLNQWATFNDLDGVAAADTPLSELLDTDMHDLERLVEFAGRHCYRSWSKGRSRDEYIRNLIRMGHGSVFEHASISFAIQGVSRSLTHELVRHRVGVAISQESQRYVDAKDIQFVVPPLHAYIAGDAHDHQVIQDFKRECERSLDAYQRCQEFLSTFLSTEDEGDHKALTMQHKRVNEASRAHLPNAAETRLTWTANVRILRHFFVLRGGQGADLEIRRLACDLLDICKVTAPPFFDDFERFPGDYGVDVIEQLS